MQRNSLRLHLLGWLLVPLVIFVGFNIWLTRRNAEETATVVQDRMLVGAARIIGEHVRYDNGVYQVEVPPAALELFQSADRDRVYYRVMSPNGLLLLGYPELPPPPRTVQPEDSVYFDSVMRSEPVRIAAFAQPMFSPAEGPVLIEVAQTLRAHDALAMQIWRHAASQQLLIIGLAVLLVLLGLWHGLAPILSLRDRVRRRKPGAVEPLDLARVPAELVPLVDAINDYARRLEQHVAARASFIANASHQLRTPLALLNTQVTYALRASEHGAKDEALRAIRSGVRQGIRLVNQLLALSIAEDSSGPLLSRSDVNLAAVVQQVLEELAGLAQAKSIDLGFDSSVVPAIVHGSPSMIHELTANLVDNALRYTPSGGVVTVAVASTATTVDLRVEDNGPGIPIEERDRVFERFSRLHEDGSGSGLGLSIVREICAATYSTIILSDATSGTGLVVTVTFPAGSQAEHPQPGSTPLQSVEMAP